MGKGVIISGGTDGQYNVELTLSRDRVDEVIVVIDAQIVILTAKIDAMEEGDAKELEKLRRNSYEKQKEYLEDNMPDGPTLSAWCGDLTEDLSGNVGTIEVPGEVGTVLIQPGYDGNAVYNTERDGQLQPSVSGTPESVYYNLAMLPGWQKWMPTYRFGTISNIDKDLDTCDVTLEAATSSQQDLDVNQEEILTGISIEYMSCNATAFKDEDSVLVKFDGQEWDGAKIIGFKDNPAVCGFQFKLIRGDDTLITELSGLLIYFKVYNSSEELLAITTPEYNAETEYWSFSIDNPEDVDPDGYWVDYLCEDGILTQYPTKYKAADKRQPGDLIIIDEYEDTIPFWKIEDYVDTEDYAGQCSGSLSSIVYLIFYDENWVRSRILKTSVSYRVTYSVDSTTNVRLVDQHETTWCNPGSGYDNIPDCSKALTVCTNSPANGIVRAVGGDIDEVNPYNGSDSDDVVIDTYTEVEHNITLSYIGLDTFDIDCYDCTTIGPDCSAVLSSFTTTYRLSGQYKSGLSIGYEYDY